MQILSKCFFCKCSFKRLNILKQVNLTLNEPLVYDGRCLGKKYKMGNVRLKVPRVGGYVGTKSKWTDVDMPVLWNESKPMFHLANVIDDSLMKVSHVFRGKDWLTNFYMLKQDDCGIALLAKRHYRRTITQTCQPRTFRTKSTLIQPHHCQQPLPQH